MKSFTRVVLDQNENVVFQEEVPAAMIDIMRTSNHPTTTPTTVNGVVSHGIWFDPDD
jgi:hypothetical protein